VKKVQHIEFDTLAPDTVEEIINARRLMEIWTAKAHFRKENKTFKSKNEDELAAIGRKILSSDEKESGDLEVLGENMENSGRKSVILKPWKAYHAYHDMLLYYAVKNLLDFMVENPKASFRSMNIKLKNKRYTEWVNLGGQIMQNEDVKKLRRDIGTGKLSNWDDIHKRYDDLWAKYSSDKQKHACAVLCELYGVENLTKANWSEAIDKAIHIQDYICDQVYLSRKKDFDNPFRQITFRNRDEMKAAYGSLDENSFIVQVRQETADFKKLAEQIKKRN
jgi:hypothetical protein